MQAASCALPPGWHSYGAGSWGSQKMGELNGPGTVQGPAPSYIMMLK
jgi:hypothetical protein